MLRRFTAGFLLIALFCCVTAASARTRTRRGRPKPAVAKSSDTKDPKDQARPVAPVASPAQQAAPLVMAPPPSAPVCDEACRQGRQRLALERRLEWFIGGLVLVGLLQVGVVAWQGWLLRRTGQDIRAQAGLMEAQAGTLKQQAEILRDSVAAAQRSADAALRQISHAVASERPWMDVQLAEKELNYSHLKFVAQNRGSSPARVTMYTVEKVLISADDAAGGPKYGNHGRFDEVQWSQWKLAGDNFIVGEFQLPPTLSSEVRQPGVCVLYQGLIRYNDTLTEDVHETRFCYEAFAPEDGPVRFRMFPAKGYNAMS